jgi:hypothetical protein
LKNTYTVENALRKKTFAEHKACMHIVILENYYSKIFSKETVLNSDVAEPH